MQTRKEERAGRLYTASQYSFGIPAGSSPRQRRERTRQTAAAKAKINRLQRKWNLVRLACENFRSGRDLFVCLTYREAPARGSLQRFHKRMKKAWEEQGLEYKYICVRETHGMDGRPAREHYHLIINGVGGRYWQARRLIKRLWDNGEADVRILSDGGDSFESMCGYLLKEKKAKGERAYSCSRNLKRPEEPIRRRVAETARLEAPPGVTLVSVKEEANEFGRWGFLVGRIFDTGAFDRYWEKTKDAARPDLWEVWARRERSAKKREARKARRRGRT